MNESPDEIETIEAELAEPTDGILVPVAEGVPQPDYRWPIEIIDEWTAIWQNREWSRYVLEDLHVPALRRLFSYRAEWQKTYEALDGGEMLVKGSRGNPRPNPLTARLIELEKTIITLEKEFGMTLKSAAGIDMTVSGAELNWAEKRKKKKA